MCACCALGIGKGIFFTYWNLVVASVVPIERLPSAFGFLMITNGIFLLPVGSLVGNFYLNIIFSFNNGIQ